VYAPETSKYKNLITHIINVGASKTIGTIEGQVEKLKLPLIEPAAACAEDGETSTLVTELHISNI
jgi:hypothetical protein